MQNPSAGRPPAGVRIHELAKECGVSSRQILGVLQTLNIYAKSPSSVVSPTDGRRVREHFAGEAVTPPQVAAGPARRIGNNPFSAPPPPRRPLTVGPRRTHIRPPSSTQNTDDSFAAALAAAQRQGLRRVRGSGSSAGKPLTGLAAEIMRRWPHQLMPDDARDWARRWVVQWMDPREVAEWWDAGMAWGDVARVALLKSLEMTPATLAEVIGDRTVLQLLHSGLSAQDVALRLRERDQQ